jgi:hypothetical protein
MPDYTVIVRKGEIFVKHWDTEIREYVEKKKTAQILSDVLQFPLVLEETNFGQFFAIIAQEKDFYQKVFNAALYGHPLEPFIKECELPAKEDGEMDYVEVEWCCEEFEGEFEFWPAFNGYGDWPEGSFGTAGTDGKIKGGIAIEFTPLNEYKHLPLKLNTESNIYSLKQTEPLAKGTRKFTVYDVIKAILFEITWAGDISKGRKGHPGCENETSEAAA